MTREHEVRCMAEAGRAYEAMNNEEHWRGERIIEIRPMLDSLSPHVLVITEDNGPDCADPDMTCVGDSPWSLS